MEIHDNRYSDYNTDVTSSSHSASGNEASVNANITGKAIPDSASNYSGGQPQELKEGSIIRGKIIDLRHNEVKILLEPDDKILTASLTGGVTLSIGRQAQFIITSYSLNRIVLQFMQPDNLSYTDDTILKALSAASLPNSKQNHTMVRALLDNQLPIDRKTLKELARIMAMNRNTNIDTIITLYKSKLPITTANIMQLEAYQSSSHQIINKIPGLAGEVAELIRYAAIEGGRPKAGTNNTPAGTGQLLKDIFTSDKLNRIGDALEELMKDTGFHGESSHIIRSIRDGSMSGTDAARFIIRLFGSGSFTDTLSDTRQTALAPDSQPAIPPASPEVASELKAMDSLTANSTGIEPEEYAKTENTSIQQEKEVLLLDGRIVSEALLNSEAEINLRDAFNVLQKSSDIYYTADAINTTNLTADIKEGLRQILNYYEPSDSAINLSNNEDIISYLMSRLTSHTEMTSDNLSDMHKLRAEIEHALRDRWSIKPKELSEKEPLVRLYKNLHEDLNRLESLIKQVNSAGDSKQPDENIRSVQDNLRFMNDLNELMSYVQLPVQIRDKNIHGDFYVYNRIKSGKEKKDGISALLHLELSSLGKVDIHIKMMQNQIQATFCINENEAGKLVATHLPELINTLTKKGYHLQARVEKSEKPTNALEDVLGNTRPSSPVHRYSFDIRA